MEDNNNAIESKLYSDEGMGGLLTETDPTGGGAYLI